MTYRKRRYQPTINKNDAKVRRRETPNQSGRVPLENVFPSLDQLTIQINSYNSKGDFISDQYLSYGPKDLFSFRIECLGPCGNGEINMEDKVKEAVRSHQSTWEGKTKCTQLVHIDSGEVCNQGLHCRFEATYKTTTV